jgi:response regulator RpfG family c-di-GMP phosphodiesterase
MRPLRFLMNWIRRLLRGTEPFAAAQEALDAPLREELLQTQRRMVDALFFSLQVRDAEIGIAEHCALVSRVAGRIAERMGVSEADAYILRTAAQLHELGMVTVPPELLRRPTPLASFELERIRSQARVSAEIARIVHHPRVATLIECQYQEHYQLRGNAEIPERDLLLAGILRVADVFTAVTWPRPYQDPMQHEHRARLLERGAGTQFHPDAADVALRVGPGEVDGGG